MTKKVKLKKDTKRKILAIVGLLVVIAVAVVIACFVKKGHINNMDYGNQDPTPTIVQNTSSLNY